MFEAELHSGGPDLSAQQLPGHELDGARCQQRADDGQAGAVALLDVGP
jgi:hypothetical protein